MLPTATSLSPSVSSVPPSASPSLAPLASAAAPATASVPTPIGSAAASAELKVFPTSSAHPDFVSGAVFVVIFVLLLTIAYTVRVLRRRRHRWD